jgi:hypothetical protein
MPNIENYYFNSDNLYLDFCNIEAIYQMKEFFGLFTHYNLVLKSGHVVRVTKSTGEEMIAAISMVRKNNV